MMKRTLLALFLAALGWSLFGGAASAECYAVTGGAPICGTLAEWLIAGVPTPVTTAAPLPVTIVGGGGGGSSGAVATAVAPTFVEGSTNALSTDLKGNLRSTGGVVDGASLTGGLSSPVAGRAQSAESTPLADGQSATFATTLTRKQIMQPFANPENFITGSPAAITTTTPTSLIAPSGGALRNYITDCLITNSHATVGTLVTITDGSGGATLWQGWAAAVGGGWAKSWNVPLRGTAATATFVVAGTTGSNVYVSCSGYKGT